MDALEQRVNSHDQANRNLLEQVMKLQQDIKVIKGSLAEKEKLKIIQSLNLREKSLQLTKHARLFQMELKKTEHNLMEEKQQRLRITTALQQTTAKITELDDRVRRTEESGKENKNALAQLISHTKNVERAVTMSQQDIMAKKEAQTQK